MSFFSSIPVWGWFDVLFNFAVLVALCGEADWALKRLIPKKPNTVPSAEWRRKKLKKKFEWLLIFGIAGEVACLPFSLLESSHANLEAKRAGKDAAASYSNSVAISMQVADLNKEAADARVGAGNAERAAGQANERAGVANQLAAESNERSKQLESTNAQLVADNLVLRSKLVALEEQMQHTITDVASAAPRNQPIKSLKADVYLEIVGTNEADEIAFASKTLKLDTLAKSFSAIFILGEKSPIAALRCKEYEIQHPIFNAGETAYSMSFEWPSGGLSDLSDLDTNDLSSWVSRNNVSTAELDKEMTAMDIYVMGVAIDKNSEIASGNCVLTINGSIQRRFSIPKHTNKFIVHCVPVKTDNLEK